MIPSSSHVGPGGEAGLTVSRAVKRFRTPEGTEVPALDDVSLDIRPGEFFVMLGPSGCGKTTLLRSIAGLETLDDGEIYLGRDRIDQLPPHRRPVNTVFQSYALFPHLTVAENIAFGLEMERMPRARVARRVEEMLELVQLPDMAARKPAQLSGGQQQRVALARALAKSPRVLLLDEPLAALDLKLRRGMQAELSRLHREAGITFVFVTHDQEEALSLGDRIAVFHPGGPSQIGTPEDVYERPADRFVATFIGESNFLTARVAPGGRSVSVLGGPPRPLPDDVPAQPGGELEIAVRPERIVLHPAGTAPHAVCRATVTGMTYMGTDLRCVVTTPGGTELKVRVAPPFPAHLRPGTPVDVEIPDDVLRPLAGGAALDAAA